MRRACRAVERRRHTHCSSRHASTSSRVPISTINHPVFRRFLQEAAPQFEQSLGMDARRRLRESLSSRYENAKKIAEEALGEACGLLTLGMDGHKDRTHRSVWTVSMLKLGISVFHHCEWSKTRSQAADEQCERW